MLLFTFSLNAEVLPFVNAYLTVYLFVLQHCRFSAWKTKFYQTLLINVIFKMQTLRNYSTKQKNTTISEPPSTTIIRKSQSRLSVNVCNCQVMFVLKQPSSCQSPLPEGMNGHKFCDCSLYFMSLYNITPSYLSSSLTKITAFWWYLL